MGLTDSLSQVLSPIHPPWTSCCFYIIPLSFFILDYVHIKLDNKMGIWTNDVNMENHDPLRVPPLPSKGFPRDVLLKMKNFPDWSKETDWIWYAEFFIQVLASLEQKSVSSEILFIHSVVDQITRLIYIIYPNTY